MSKRSRFGRHMRGYGDVWMIGGLVFTLLTLGLYQATETVRQPPLITLCEYGHGAEVARLSHLTGAIDAVTVTDADGNYNFQANDSSGLEGNYFRFMNGKWPIYLLPSNFEPGGALERYQVMHPDMQFMDVPEGGLETILAYHEWVNGLDPEAPDYADELDAARESLTTWSPCFEMVRKPAASVAITKDLLVKDDLIVYAEAEWPEVVIADSDVLTVENVIVTAGPYTPSGIQVLGGGGLSYEIGVTPTLTIGNGITLSARFQWQAPSGYPVTHCDPWDLVRARWRWESCMDEWVYPVAGQERTAIDGGRFVVTGTAVIEPAIDTAVWPLQSVTCALTAVSASAMYCTVDDGLTVTVWDSSFAVSETAVQVAWVGLASR